MTHMSLPTGPPTDEDRGASAAAPAAAPAHASERLVVTDPLGVVALEVERHVAEAGWDQGWRMFALAPTAQMLAAEPELVKGLGGLRPGDLAPGALSAVEQEDLPEAVSVEELLAKVAWPEAVAGCALSLERIVVPPGAERDLPDDDDAALAALADHPDRQDIRLVVAVTRPGRSVCLLRQRAHDRDDAVAMGSDLAPGLIEALRQTLQD